MKTKVYIQPQTVTLKVGNAIPMLTTSKEYDVSVSWDDEENTEYAD